MGGNTEERFLLGINEIVDFVKRPWSIIKRWIKEKKFPAKKIDGKWESNTALIWQWRREQIMNTQKDG